MARLGVGSNPDFWGRKFPDMNQVSKWALLKACQRTPVTLRYRATASRIDLPRESNSFDACFSREKNQARSDGEILPGLLPQLLF